MRPLVFPLTILIITLTSSSCASLSSFFGLSSAPDQGNIPARSNQAMSGSVFIKSIEAYNDTQREHAIVREILSGNIPDFLRRLAPVHFEQQFQNKRVTATVWVMPDYLAIGNNHDFVRIPMTPVSAQKIADQFGFILPTPKMVDVIYEQAQSIFKPQSLPPGPSMTTTAIFWKHHLMIERQSAGKQRQQLSAGHKKDIVLSRILDQRRNRLALYGWHRSTKNPIQPLSTAHHDLYVDYSHGVRLVSKMMLYQGQKRSVPDILRNPETAAILSSEGALNKVRVTTDDRYSLR